MWVQVEAVGDRGPIHDHREAGARLPDDPDPGRDPGVPRSDMYGLPQFGHEYESSAAKFRVFKCVINMYHPGGGMVACGPSRFRAVTGDQPGHARLVLLRKGKCS
jgi:hypothetical protein